MNRNADNAATNIALEIQSYLERLKSGVVKDYEQIFPKIEKLTSDALGALRVDKLSEASLGQLNTAIAQVRSATTELYFAQNAELVDSLAEIGGFVVGREANLFEKRLSSAVKEFNWEVPGKSFQNVLKRPITATGDLLKPFTKTVVGPTVRKMEGAIRNGWAQGDTVGSVMRTIRGTKAAGYRDGILNTSKHQAEAMVRTATQHVANSARLDFYIENDDLVKGYSWVSTLDGKTSSICRSLDGQTYKFNEGPVPPAHPNCRSTIKPELSSEFDFLDEGATRSSEFGYVDANTTYYDWLKNQSDEFVDDVLGKSRGALFRNGGLTPDEFSRLNLGRNFKPLTLQEMYAKDPASFKKAGIKPRGAQDIDDLLGDDAPRPGTKRAAAWDLFDDMKTTSGKTPTLTEALTEAKRRGGVESGKVRGQYADWLAERGEAPIVPTAPTRAIAPVKKTAIKKANDSELAWRELSQQLDEAFDSGQPPKANLKERIRLMEIEFNELKEALNTDKLRGIEMDGETYRSVQKRFNKLAGELSDLYEGQRGFTLRISEAMKAVLFGNKSSVKFKRPTLYEAPTKAAATAAARVMDSAFDTLEGILSPRIITLLNKNKSYNRILVKEERAAFFSGTKTIKIRPNENVSTAIHEIVHAIEYADPEISKKTKAFLKKRSEGKKARALSRLVPGAGYQPGEIAYEDKWKERGGNVYIGKVYSRASTELLTMGVERLLRAPSTFKQRDPEYFEFVVRILRDL